jgi:hypothetical protein
VRLFHTSFIISLTNSRIDWEARRAAISRTTVAKIEVEEQKLKTKGKKKAQAKKKGKNIGNEEQADHVDLLERMSLVEDDGTSQISVGSAATAVTAQHPIPKLDKMDSSSSVGSKNKRPNIFKSLTDMSRRSSTQSTESITDAAVAQAVSPTVEITKQLGNDEPARKKSWTNSLRLRKNRPQMEEVANPLAEKANAILEKMREEEAGWRQQRDHPVFAGKNDAAVREDHHAKAHTLLDHIGRLMIVSDTWENALRKKAVEDEEEQKSSKAARGERRSTHPIEQHANVGTDSLAQGNAPKVQIATTAVHRAPDAGLRAFKSKYTPEPHDSGDDEDEDARKATVASRLTRTGWVSDLVQKGPKALLDFDNMGYDVHRAEGVVEGMCFFPQCVT